MTFFGFMPRGMNSKVHVSNFAENTHNPHPYEVNKIKNINVDQKVKFIETVDLNSQFYRSTYGNFLQLFRNRGLKTSMLFVSFLIE